jgi:hypothetical protein
VRTAGPTQLGLLTLSRDLYFAVISLIGSQGFDLKILPDFHHQRDGIREGEAARFDDMIERVRGAGG